MVMMNSRYQLVGDEPAPFVPRPSPLKIYTGSGSSFTVPNVPAPVQAPSPLSLFQGAPQPLPAPSPMPQSFMPSFDVLTNYAPQQPAAPAYFGPSSNDMVSLPPMSIPAPQPQPTQVQLPAGEPAVAYAPPIAPAQPTQGMGQLGSALQAVNAPAAIQNVMSQAQTAQPAARAPMSYELQKLLNHYGVGTPVKPAYAGAVKPATGADDYQALLDKYNTDNSAYTNWANEYDQRMKTPMYGPGYQGAALQPLQYPNGYQAPTVTTPATTTPPIGASNPLAPEANMGGNGTIGFGTGNETMGGFVSDPNSYTGGLLNAMIGQSPIGVPVTDIDPITGVRSSDFGNGIGGYGTDGYGQSVSGIDGGHQSSFGSGSLGGTGGGLGMSGDSNDSGMSGSDADGGEANGGADGLGGDNYRAGGLAGLHRKYAGGGLVPDFGGVGEDPSVGYAPPSMGAEVEGNMGLDPSRLTAAQAQFLAQQDPQAMARGVSRFGYSGLPPGNPPESPAMPTSAQPETLEQMAAAYDSPEMAMYAQEYQAARKQAALDRAKFESLLQSSLDRKDEAGPSKAEMYFQLAAAFGAPTKTGSFGESLGSANTVLAGHQKELRQSALSARDRKDKLALEVAKYHADGSKDDVTNLRTLAVKEMDARKAALEPKSEFGKEALDLNLKRGTPEFTAYVNKRTAQAQALKDAGVATGQANTKLAQDRLAEQQRQAAMLTPTEATALGKEQVARDAKVSLMKSLGRARALSDAALSGSGIDKARGFFGGLTGSTASPVVAKENLDQILNQAALDFAARLKPMSDTDILFAQKLTGLAGTSKASRGKQIESLFNQAAEEVKQHDARMAKIKSRENRTQSPQATSLPEPLDVVPTGE